MEENRRKLLPWTGLIGSGLMALCCVTPILVLLLGVIVLEAIWRLETETAAKLVGV
jgi:mercuric ion transport protein